MPHIVSECVNVSRRLEAWMTGFWTEKLTAICAEIRLARFSLVVNNSCSSGIRSCVDLPYTGSIRAVQMARDPSSRPGPVSLPRLVASCSRVSYLCGARAGRRRATRLCEAHESPVLA